MKLNIQVYSLFYSFLFGIILYYLLDLFNKYIMKCTIIIKIIISLLFVMLLSLFYFMGLLYINNGYLHIYFLIIIMVGYMFVYLLKYKWFTYKNKNCKM